MDGHLGPSEDRVVVFDRYVLEVRARRLLLKGSPIALPARAFDLLVILVEQRGTAVSRERLYQLLWPNGFVEDGNLTQNIYLLRRILDPSGNGRRFIETLPRHGYRFAAPVTTLNRPLLTVRWNVPAFHVFRVAIATFVAILTVLLSGSAQRSEISPLGPQAATSYALGVYHWNMRTPEQIDRSIGYFKQTIALAPRNPLGYAGLAGVYAIKAENMDAGSAGDVLLAQRYRDDALSRDPNNAEAHAVSAFIDERFHHDAAAAEREYAIVFAFKPGYATAHHWHAVMRLTRGDIGGALAEWELAHRLDPTSEVISRWLGIAYFYAHRPDDAIAMLTETINLQPGDHEAWIQLASAQEQRGRFAQAIAALERVRRNVPHKGPYVAVLEARVKVVSRHGVADASTLAQVQRIAATKNIDPAALAYFFAALGRRDEVLSLLRRSAQKYDMYVSMEQYDPRFDALRSDPRFRKIFD